jgi:hypothetical protein
MRIHILISSEPRVEFKAMKHGKEMRIGSGQQTNASSENEIMALMFVMVERTPGAFGLRFITNDDLLEDLQKQGMLRGFLEDADKLYAEFRKRFDKVATAERPN